LGFIKRHFLAINTMGALLCLWLFFSYCVPRNFCLCEALQFFPGMKCVQDIFHLLSLSFHPHLIPPPITPPSQCENDRLQHVFFRAFTHTRMHIRMYAHIQYTERMHVNCPHNTSHYSLFYV
jgi:hypothetical protein